MKKILYNISFNVFSVFNDSVESHIGHIDTATVSVENDFRYCPAHSGWLLYPMTTESCGKYQVIDNGMTTDYGILVKGVEIIPTCPCTHNLIKIKTRHTL